MKHINANSVASYALAGALAAFMAPSAGMCADDIDLQEIVRNPVIGNYKGYAEFKMAHYDNARVIWETLAERGNPEASFNLGILHEDGLGVPANIEAAIAAYERAAIGGSSRAQYRLGLLYSGGAKISKDDVKAERWLTVAAAQGDKDAAAMLAQRAGVAGKPAEQAFFKAESLRAEGRNQEAVAIWTELARKGHPRARSRLAWMLESGQGIARNLEAAATLFRQAAEQGDADAQYALAVMLKTGKGQERDDVQAESWLRRAAAQGHGPANAALTTK
jgi:TPR repeat protein